MQSIVLVLQPELLPYPNHTEIVKITTPNIFDKLGRFFFIRSKNGAQPYINKAWKRSNGTLIYLGEWHTHPEMDPKPSFDDTRMIKTVLNETVMEINFLYLIIVGQNNSLWVGKRTQDALIELKKENN